MKDKISKSLSQASTAKSILREVNERHKNAVLKELSSLIKKYHPDLLNANSLDIKLSQQQGKNSAYIDRLTLTPSRIQSLIDQLHIIQQLPDPTGQIIQQRQLPNGVQLSKRRVPIGTIGIIYESRPNVTIDVAALCLKSGNVSVLRGSSSALHSNRFLVKLIHQALESQQLPTALVTFIDSPDRQDVAFLLSQSQYLDLIIPRGGYDLVNLVVSQSRIPVLYHAAGGARIYVDESADLSQALQLCVNSKVNRPATCNSLDTILLHQSLASQFLPQLMEQIVPHHVQVFADQPSQQFISTPIATDDQYHTEFLDYKLTIKLVAGIGDAIQHIHAHTKHHTEAIISQDQPTIDQFISQVDAAAIMVNCSTRLHDGAEFGLGAEIGIATGKLHARGPVGLQELTTYQWVANGTGQLKT